MGRETLRVRSWENSNKKHPALRGDPGIGGVLSPEAADTLECLETCSMGD